jgi:hypothetical protein
VQSITNDNFGPLIAYLVPRATALLGASQLSPDLQTLFAIGPANAPTIGGFLYLTVASLAAGMTISAVRWALIDTLHHRTGLRFPSLDFSTLGQNVGAFTLLIESHYRHYQFHANMVVATAVAYACYRAQLGNLEVGLLDAAFITLETVFFVTSRDNLRKYYTRSEQLLMAPRRASVTSRSTRLFRSPAPGVPRRRAR